ncbi:hypothetical protein GCM10009847_19950 [Leucobacter tardus]|uniref:Uncharacterized protein n=1 Tax=Leucobacter tardus TaxID=501483 RepID=A0A939QGL5_9MICO|nr:hypothetical protein [Leucobacter tardus]MBO2990490.1 hypothetical protein [Leucobacter tardus]
MASRITGWGAAAIIVALYIYAVVAAVGNLLGMVGFLGDALSATAYIALIGGIAAPPLGLAAALWLGRGRTGGVRLLLLAAGLCGAAALQLDVLHLMG